MGGENPGGGCIHGGPCCGGGGGDRREGSEGRIVEIGNVGAGDASFWDARGHPSRLVIDGEDRWYGDSWAWVVDW